MVKKPGFFSGKDHLSEVKPKETRFLKESPYLSARNLFSSGWQITGTHI
jgi:hypothetical protein